MQFSVACKSDDVSEALFNLAMKTVSDHAARHAVVVHFAMMAVQTVFAALAAGLALWFAEVELRFAVLVAVAVGGSLFAFTMLAPPLDQNRVFKTLFEDAFPPGRTLSFQFSPSVFRCGTGDGALEFDPADVTSVIFHGDGLVLVLALYAVPIPYVAFGSRHDEICRAIDRWTPSAKSTDF